jgi:hypothetical protein
MTAAPGTPPTRPGHEPEGASFATASVASGRGSQPLLILGFIVAVGAVVAIGVGGQASGPASTPHAAIASPTAAPARTAASGPLPTRQQSARAAGPVVTSEAGDVQLLARRASSSIFVHGEVFLPRVTWVFVSLQDDAGNVAGWSSVSIPGAAGPGQGAGPTIRFDVELAIPDSFSGRLWVHANVYDSSGLLVSSSRLEVGP